MDQLEARQQHQRLALLGIKDTGTTAGLLQLCCELLNAKVLDEPAVERIKDAIVSDISLSCPRSMARTQYEIALRQRMDGLLPHH